MPIIFVMQGKCLFSDISRPDDVFVIYTLFRLMLRSRNPIARNDFLSGNFLICGDSLFTLSADL